MEVYALENKRKLSRVDFKVEALVKAADSTIKGEVKDISLHGVFIRTAETMPVGTPVELTIYLTILPPCIVVNVKGVVVRSLEDGIGCTFDKIDAESFAHIRSIISYQCGDDAKVMSEFFDYVKNQTPAKQNGTQ